MGSGSVNCMRSEYTALWLLTELQHTLLVAVRQDENWVILRRGEGFSVLHEYGINSEGWAFIEQLASEARVWCWGHRTRRPWYKYTVCC